MELQDMPGCCSTKVLVELDFDYVIEDFFEQAGIKTDEWGDAINDPTTAQHNRAQKIREKSYLEEVQAELRNQSKFIIAQTNPSQGVDHLLAKAGFKKISTYSIRRGHLVTNWAYDGYAVAKRRATNDKRRANAAAKKAAASRKKK